MSGQANPQRHMVNLWGQRLGGEMAGRFDVSFLGDDSVLTLDSGDGYATLNILKTK